MRARRLLIAAALASASLAAAPAAAPAQAREDMALGQPAVASSVEPARPDGTGPCSPVLCAAGMATDGNDATRWGSAFAEPQWWQVDLGRVRRVDTVALTWHVARARHYSIRTSIDGEEFIAAAEVTMDLSASEIVALTASQRYVRTTQFDARRARYVRVVGHERAPIVRASGEVWRFGFSLWNVSVFGLPDVAANPGDDNAGNDDDGVTPGNKTFDDARSSIPLPDGVIAPGAAPAPGSPSGEAPDGRLRMMRPFPVVRIKGRSTAQGAQIELLSVRAPKRATIRASCRGIACPARVARRNGGLRRIRELQRSLPAGTVVTVRITRPGAYGKYTRFVIRRGAVPKRTDRCLRGSGRRPVACPTG